MKTMKVIVTDGDYLHTLGIVRYLGIKGVEVHVLGSVKWMRASYSKYCRKRFIGPSPVEDEKGFLDYLENLFRSESYDLLMPVGFKSTGLIAQNRERFQPYVRVEIASYQAICTAMNKKNMYKIAEKLKIPYPRTIYPKTFEEAKDISGSIDYPVVIKGLFEAGKQVIAYPKNQEEFLSYYEKLCRENDFKEGTLPMVQEYIGPGGNECLAALYQRGEIKRFAVYKALRCFPVKGGASSCAATFYNDEIFNYGKKLLDEIQWHGVADVEFKRDKRSGQLKLMEVNPKFYATVEVAMRAGQNFPYYLCQMARGEELEFSDQYKRNLVYHYPLSKELIHFKEKPGSIFPIILDSLNPRVKSNVWLKDLIPNIIELTIQVLSFLPEKLKKFLKKMFP